MTRKPAVAGSFYPGTERSLLAQLDEFIDKDIEKRKVIGVMSPHAGYVYSGMVAGKLFSSIVISHVAVIMGPNHRGIGSDFAIMTAGSWATPLGEVPIDKSLAKSLLAQSSLLVEDETAHAYEHSLEVQVPFLQHLRPDIRIVPICMGGYHQDDFVKLGHEIATCVKESGEEALIIASSDMSHYEPHEQAKKKDMLAIDAILRLDEKEMLERVRAHNISMCGYAPTAAMLAAAKDLDARNAELVLYQTSGDVAGDYSQVVGYAGIIVY